MLGPHKLFFYSSSLITFARILFEGAIGIAFVSFGVTLLGSEQQLPDLFKVGVRFFQIDDENKAIPILLIVAAMIVRQFIIGIDQTIQSIAQARIGAHLRTRIAGNIIQARFSFLDQFKAGWLSQVIANDCLHVRAGFTALLSAVSGALFLLITLALMIQITLSFTAGLLFVIILFAPVKYLIAIQVNRFSKKARDASYDVMQNVNDVFYSIRQIKLLNLQNLYVNKIRSNVLESAKHSVRSDIYAHWEPTLIQIVALVLVVLAFLVNHYVKFFDVSLIVGFLILFYRAIPSAMQSAKSLNTFVSKQPGIARVHDMYDLQKSNMEELGTDNDDLLIAEKLEFQSVSMGYGKGENILANVSFVAAKGEIIAITGESGTGKSTLLAALTKMYPINSGAIKINDISIDQISIKQLRNLVSIVPQQYRITSMRVHEVIRGDQSSMSETDMITAAKTANAHEFIMRLKDGYDTMIGQQGAGLSGGQIQRLILAQVLARKSPILVLDEATNSLDEVSEQEILNALAKIKENHIVLMVTHQGKNVELADRVFSMKAGKIIETPVKEKASKSV